MKKNYELPTWEIILFDKEDVITGPSFELSDGDGGGGNDVGEWD